MNKVAITREYFKKVIEEVKEVIDVRANVNECLSKFSGFECEISYPDCTTIVTDTLGMVMENTTRGLIDHFVFCLDFGRKYEDGCVIDKDGKNVSLSTVDELYSVLMMDEDYRNKIVSSDNWELTERKAHE